jgi:hypothetical protein
MVAVVLSAVSLLAGCASPDITLVDIGTGRPAVDLGYAPMRQVVVSVDDATRSFRTMFRDGDHLVLRTLDYDGGEQNRQRMPLFKDGYCDSAGWSLAPDAGGLVYLKQATGDFRLIELPSSRETVLCSDLGRFDLDVPFVRWLSGDKVLLAVKRRRDIQGSANRILELDVRTKSTRTLATPASLSHFDYALSPDLCRLAYWEDRSGESVYPDECINVMDVRTGNIEAVLTTDGKNDHLYRPRWSPDGRTIGYFAGRKIILYSLDTGASRTLASFDSDTICYDLAIGRDAVVFHGGKRRERAHDWKRLPPMVYDLQTGKPTREIDVDINGKMMSVDGGRKLLCETGY